MREFRLHTVEVPLCGTVEIYRHDIIHKKNICVVTHMRIFKLPQNGLGIVPGVALQIKQPESLVEPLGDLLVRQSVCGCQLFPGGLIRYVPDVFRPSRLQIGPFSELLLRQLAGIRADGVSLIHSL